MKKIKLRVRFNSSRDAFEKFSSEAYLLYLTFPEDEESIDVLKEILSRRLGTPVSDISYMGQDNLKNYLFILD